MKGTIRLLFALFPLLCACGNGHSPLLPRSGGKPYEVLLIGDEDSLIYKVLDADAEGLPQSEPSFDISTTDMNHFNQSVRLARSIVIVNIDKKLFTNANIKYEKNVYAEPQMIVYVNAPSVNSIRMALPKMASQLRKLLVRAEMNAEIMNLKTRQNAKATSMIRQRLGCEILIPADMTSHKEGKDFIWMSNNAATGMQNICVYALPENEDIIKGRDSVMKINMPGEEKGMYMMTAAKSVECSLANEKGEQMMIARGLWEMRNDAMGGPFVLHAVTDKLNHRVIVAEAFVYAPEMNKRNKLRQIEAALYTLKIKE
jgi:uncharacterized UPF0146 family protein